MSGVAVISPVSGAASPARPGSRSRCSFSMITRWSAVAVRDLLEAEPDIRVVGDAGTAASALARIPALRPDVAVLDVRLPDGDGVSVCRQIRSRMPEVACLMLTSFGDDEALFGAIMAGAAGYVLERIHGSDLVGAVRTVACGQSMLDPRAASQLMARLRDQPGRHDPLAGLSAPGAPDPGADRGGPDQPADRRADGPGRKDREELRVRAVRQAGHASPHPGRRLCRPRLRLPPRHRRWRTSPCRARKYAPGW